MWGMVIIVIMYLNLLCCSSAIIILCWKIAISPKLRPVFKLELVHCSRVKKAKGAIPIPVQWGHNSEHISKFVSSSVWVCLVSFSFPQFFFGLVTFVQMLPEYAAGFGIGLVDVLYQFALFSVDQFGLVWFDLGKVKISWLLIVKYIIAFPKYTSVKV